MLKEALADYKRYKQDKKANAIQVKLFQRMHSEEKRLVRSDQV
jgi:hypothetical protein